MKSPYHRLLAVAIVLTSAISVRAQLSDSEKLNPAYLYWLDKDVRWIITDQERSDFLQLSNDVARNNFIEQFWMKRNPHPGSATNEFKAEHYPRIAYANAHFSEKNLVGSRTDRGTTYIVLGPPVKVILNPVSAADKSEPRSEVWHYQLFPDTYGDQCEAKFSFMVCVLSSIQWIREHPQGILLDVTFADKCKCGEYKIQPNYYFEAWR